MHLNHDLVSNFRHVSHPVALMRPSPNKLSGLLGALRALEESGTYSNNGPIVRQLEQAMCERLFGGVGDCVTVSNATLGLMLAMRQAADAAGRPGGFALMPSFTFAAAAQAALWAGLTPLLCDIDPLTWSASAAAEEAMLARYGDEISVVVPYATFGNGIELDRYDDMARAHGVGVVVDAAASLGARDAAGSGFATGSRMATVFSMHATKPFAVAEGGVIYSADAERTETLRRMGNFGFGAGRSAELPGLNAKMSEIMALLARAKLDHIEAISQRRAALAHRYRDRLEGVEFQAPVGLRQAYAFMPVLLPASSADRRSGIMAAMSRYGIGTGTYFSPHLAEQPYFKAKCRAGPLEVTETVASRILALPIYDDMTDAELDHVAGTLNGVLRA